MSHGLAVHSSSEGHIGPIQVPVQSLTMAKVNSRKKQSSGSRSGSLKNGNSAHHQKKSKHDGFKTKDKKFPDNKKNQKEKKQNKSKYASRNRAIKKARSDSESEFEEVSATLTGNVQKTIEETFPSVDVDADQELKETRKLFQQQNRKKKKSGGFQSMGLSQAVYKGVIRKGYKIPTPIQRKTIPLIMDGKDVVAMARTGSGKTAAFLLPMFENLKGHLTSGVRALILAPTRELAVQTLKFTKELGRFTGLKFAVVLGGDSMEEQFAAIHENPDVIIATPGRFMHVLVEMELKLTAVQYLVFDEADRLFEMGFQEQMREILQRVPENRQTVLFSATLPKLLVDFAKAGLHDPTLIRLDVDSKLSENLKMAFLQCQSENKMAALLHLLRNVVKPSEQTVIFAATKHHVEYLNQVLLESGFKCSYSYSSLDQTARKINVAKFRNKTSMILIVTDLAARGIDIPLLDNVINYNFPAKSKLFVHRVGRVARAGRSGTAYSLVSPDEVAYVIDLHLFLGRPLQYVGVGKTYPVDEALYGLVPQSVIDDEEQNLRQIMQIHDIAAQHKVVSNAYKHYLKSRPPASSESIKRSKDRSEKIGYHPLYGSISADVEAERAKLLNSMKVFKPRGTIFEVNASKKTDAFNVMKTKRRLHANVIQRSQLRQQDRDEGGSLPGENHPVGGLEVNEQDINETFSTVVAPKANKGLFDPLPSSKHQRKKSTDRDEEFYVSYRPKDHHTEQGFSMRRSNFEMEADKAALDITGDDATEMRKQQNQLRWDRKRKKYVAETGNEPGKKRMKTESGQWISSTYKSNIYKDWLAKNKVADKDDASDSENEGNSSPGKHARGKPGKSRSRNLAKGDNWKQKGVRNNGRSRGSSSGLEKGFHNNKNELKQKDQILKQRRKTQKLQSFMKFREKRKHGKGKQTRR